MLTAVVETSRVDTRSRRRSHLLHITTLPYATPALYRSEVIGSVDYSTLQYCAHSTTVRLVGMELTEEALRSVVRSGLSGSSPYELWNTLGIIDDAHAQRFVLSFLLGCKHVGFEALRSDSVETQTPVITQCGSYKNQRDSERDSVWFESPEQVIASQAYKLDRIRVVASEASRKGYLGIHEEIVPVAYTLLEFVGKYGEEGIAKKEINARLGMEPKEVYRMLKYLRARALM